ncbi:MAG: Planctomycete cytochrome, partial [Chthoniobacteraceae bacterium]|nr:Planctomycete cytochrome [Chthoniobacteraceae bacterium]
MISQSPLLRRLAVVTLLLVPGFADAEINGAEFFEKNVRPILQENCFKCHSHAEKIKGGLALDSLEGALSGGETSPAVVPGDLAKSLLVEAIGYKNDDLQMPPKGKKLSEAQIGALTQWISMGAPWPVDPNKKKMVSRPKGSITAEDRQWWAFQPVADQAPPTVDDHGWAANEIDRFIFKKLGEAGLSPSPRASKAKLVRRLYFDVIGLPPTPEQVAAFEADSSPEAWEKLVDSLLASPRYGERWARHWLDLVRYADSDGFRVDDYRPHSWRYRDYVIAAFNDDKPYDRFIQEQIAGDEMFPDDPRAHIATGFLRHWIYEYNNRDVPGQWTNILNDVTDVTADVFLGLGVQCARCHDHKFDPILQKDYYRLQAFLAPLVPTETAAATESEQNQYADKLAPWEQKTAALRAQIATLEAPYRQKAAEEAIGKFPEEIQALIHKPVSERAPLEHQLAELAYRQVDYEFGRLLTHVPDKAKKELIDLQKELTRFDKEKPQPLPVAFGVGDVGPIAPVVRIPKKEQLGDIAPGFLTIFGEEPARIEAKTNSTGRRTALARWLTTPDNALVTRVI